MKFADLLLQEQAAERFGIKNDKFYTKPEIAKFCISKCNINSYDRIIEPSAGSGAFSSQIPNCEAYDLVPEGKSIKKQDFLKFNTDKGNILVIGNPPFGKANDLSLKFINNAAKFAKTIAFILPKSCQKETFLNKLDKHVHLRRVVQLPKNSFIINGKIPYDVNCNFFIFDVKDKERAVVEKPTTNDFIFTRDKNIADFAILRKGYKVGRLIPKDDTHFSEASKYYIKSNIGKKELWKRLLTVTYPEAGMALGSDSISQLEIIRNYNLKFGTLKEDVKDDAAEFVTGQINGPQFAERIKDKSKKELDNLTKNDIINADDVRSKLSKVFKIVDTNTYSKEDEVQSNRLRRVATLDGGLPIYQINKNSRKKIDGYKDLSYGYNYFFEAPKTKSAIGAYVQEAAKKILKFTNGAFVGYTDSQDGVGAIKQGLRENLPVQVKAVNGVTKKSTAGNYDSLNNYNGDKILVSCTYTEQKENTNNVRNGNKIYFRIDNVKIENTSKLLNSNRKILAGLRKAASTDSKEAKEFYSRFLKSYNEKTAFKDIGRIISKIYREMCKEGYDKNSLKKILESALGNSNIDVTLRTGGRNMEVRYKDAGVRGIQGVNNV